MNNLIIKNHIYNYLYNNNNNNNSHSMEMTFIEEIKLIVLIKGKHFYKKRLVNIHNGIFRYFSTSSSGALRFQADLLDFSIIEQNINKDKPVLMLTSKSNAFSPLKIYHEHKTTLLHFKQQLEQMLEWEKEKNAIHVKSKKLADLVQKYALNNIFHLRSEIKATIDAQYIKYKQIHDISIETNDLDKIKKIDTGILYQNSLIKFKQSKHYSIKEKLHYQVVLVNIIGLLVGMMILYNLTTEGYFYQIILIIFIIFGLPYQIKLFLEINCNNQQCNHQTFNLKKKPDFVIKSNALMTINIFQIIDYLMIALYYISSDNNNTKLKNKGVANNSDNRYEVYTEATVNQITIIERNKASNEILGIFVLKSFKQQTETILYSYCFPSQDYPFEVQQIVFNKLILINTSIRKMHENSFFNQKEAFLFDEEVELKIENRDEIELKVDQLFGANSYDEKLHFNEQSLDYYEIITYNCQSDNNTLEGIMLKEDIVVVLDKELIKLFLSSGVNVTKVNKYIKQALLICKEETIIEVVIELENIGDISFTSKQEIGDIEINSIKYSIISFFNINEDNKIIEHFGFYIWKSDNKTHITSWIMFESIDDFKTKNTLISSMKVFLEHNNQIEAHIQEEMDNSSVIE